MSNTFIEEGIFVWRARGSGVSGWFLILFSSFIVQFEKIGIDDRLRHPFNIRVHGAVFPRGRGNGSDVLQEGLSAGTGVGCCRGAHRPARRH